MDGGVEERRGEERGGVKRRGKDTLSVLVLLVAMWEEFWAFVALHYSETMNTIFYSSRRENSRCWLLLQTLHLVDGTLTWH